MKNLLGYSLAAPIVVGVLGAAVCYEGFVIAALWNWHAAPLFNLPALSIPRAIGLSSLAGMCTRQLVDTSWCKGWEIPKALFLTPTVALALGWCAKQFQ